MDIKAFLEALSFETRNELEAHFIDGYQRDLLRDLRTNRLGEEWSRGVEEWLVEEMWGDPDA